MSAGAPKTGATVFTVLCIQTAKHEFKCLFRVFVAAGRIFKVTDTIGPFLWQFSHPAFELTADIIKDDAGSVLEWEQCFFSDHRRIPGIVLTEILINDYLFADKADTTHLYYET